MSDTDKARQKLVDSMRKTKAASDDTPAPTKKAAAGKRPSSRTKTRSTAARTTKPRATAARTAKTGSTAAAAAKTGARGGAVVTERSSGDPYQASPRVWPD